MDVKSDQKMVQFFTPSLVHHLIMTTIHVKFHTFNHKSHKARFFLL